MQTPANQVIITKYREDGARDEFSGRTSQIMGTSVTIASGKGGTGKTVCCAALGSALAILGHTALCVDCDAGLGNLDLVLGLNDTLWDFGDILRGSVSAEQAVTAHPDIKNLGFLSAPIGADDLDAEAFRGLVDDLKARYDYVLLDSPAGLDDGFTMTAKAADSALIVVTPDLPSRRDGGRTTAKLMGCGVENIRLIINRVEPDILKKSGVTLDDVIDEVGARLIGMVYEDDSVRLATAHGKPLLLYGARFAYDQFFNIAGRLTGEKVPIQTA